VNKTRLEAFSDGVVAIIITIMVLELKVPHESTWQALWNLLPVFTSYSLSFIYVAIYWVNHHHLLHTVKHVKSSIMWANFGLLFTLSLIPFTTGWMGVNHYSNIPMAVYAMNLLVCGIAYYILEKTIMNCYEHSTKLIKALKKQERKGIYSLILYIVSIPFAFISPIISSILFIAVAIMWIIPDKNIEEALKNED